MTTYTSDQLQENYNKFILFISTSFTGDRKDKLLKLHTDFEEQIILSPASSKKHFHLAYVGGYMDHILNVCKASRGVKKLYVAMGGTIDFTDDELLMCCLCHDLGKLGDKGTEYYIPQDIEWHLKRGEVFKINGELQKMHVTHRSLYLLQQYDIKLTQKEYIGILTSDGIYCEDNKYYFCNDIKDNSLKTNLPYIVHLSDFIACRTENDQEKLQ